MGLTEWAYKLSESLLSDPLPRRWAHSLGVAQRARSLGPILGDDAELLEAAAVLHDIGYSPAIAATGFHPLDGARFLRDREGADERVVRLVAHHSCALLEAEERGLRPELEGEFELERPDLVDALLYCDMTTTPDGTQTTPAERLDEIVQRYGSDTVVGRFIQRAAPEIRLEACRGPDDRRLSWWSTDVGLSPRVIEAVPDAQHHRRVDVQPVKVRRINPADLFRFAACP